MGKGCLEAIYGLMGWKGLRNNLSLSLTCPKSQMATSLEDSRASFLDLNLQDQILVTWLKGAGNPGKRRAVNVAHLLFKNVLCNQKCMK